MLRDGNNKYKNELLNMFSIENPDFAAQLSDEEWSLSYNLLAHF
jgi:hypothetical protein